MDVFSFNGQSPMDFFALISVRCSVVINLRHCRCPVLITDLFNDVPNGNYGLRMHYWHFKKKLSNLLDKESCI